MVWKSLKRWLLHLFWSTTKSKWDWRVTALSYREILSSRRGFLITSNLCNFSWKATFPQSLCGVKFAYSNKSFARQFFMEGFVQDLALFFKKNVWRFIESVKFMFCCILEAPWFLGFHQGKPAIAWEFSRLGLMSFGESMKHTRVSS